MAHMDWEHDSVESNLDDILRKIRPYYDFIDCKLLLDMSNKFLQDVTFTDGGVTYKLANELHSHTHMSKSLCTSKTVSELKKLLQEHYKPFDRNMDHFPCINIHLQTCWDDISIDGLYKLIEKFLPQKYRQSIVKHITIFNGSVVIKLHILDITADSLLEYTGGKLQFMRLIGIFSLYINDHPVLQEDENMNFTFELALLEAVTAGNNEAVEFLLQLETVNIDHTNEEGKTALMLACERGHEDIIHSLLSTGANVNIQDNYGWTALMRASEHNHISIIHMLLEANANPHLKKSNGSNALMITSYNGNYEVVELLISKGVDYKYQREDGWNAFMFACLKGHIQIVELLLKQQVDPNVQKEDGWNAFMSACQNGHIQIVELLLKQQVDPNVQKEDGWNAFMSACQNGHTQIVELLLKQQVDPNVQKEDGWNAFMSACQNGHTQIVELLLKQQVDPNVQKEDGWNAFMSACQNGHTQIVELLLKEQIDPNVQKKDSLNAFMLACANGHTQIVELLLKEQVDPNVQDKDGLNAFMLACQNGHTQIVELLLKEQVDPNVQDKDGLNAFMLACQNGHTQIVELLLKEQVDPNVQDKDGLNAFMLACQNGHTQIVELLLKEQVDPNVQENDGWNAFMLACQNGHTQIVELLLKEQVDPNVQENDGWNAFMLACANGHTQIVELLLRENADPNIQTNDQFTSLIIACSTEIDNVKIVRLLLQYGADPNAKIHETGATPLLLAVNFGRSEILTELINAGANVSETFSMPSKPFSYTNIQVPISGNREIIYNLSTGDVTIVNNSGSSSVLYNMKQLKFTLIQCAVVMFAFNEGKDKHLQSVKQEIMNISQFGKEIDAKEVIEVLSQVSIDKRLEIIKVLLPKCPDNDPYTLMLAASFGLTQVVDLLLKAGYDPQEPLSSSKTFEQFTKPFQQVSKLDFTNSSLVAACSEGHLGVVRLLLRKTHDINHQQETAGETFLMLACECGHKDIVLTLLETGADPNICDNDGDNALHYVLLSNSSEDNILDIIQTLLSWNINVNGQNNNGMTPLMMACSKGYTEAILLLLDKADPNITDNKGKTALMYTCENGHSEIVEHLLRTYEADPLQKSNNGISALSYAAYSGNIEVINILLYKYNPDQEEIEKAVTAACYGGHKESIKLLVADKIIITNYQRDILTACMSDDVEFINNQTSSDLCTPLIESTGLTPLMIAASCGSDGVVQTLLLIYGADVNQQDTYLNYTPLMYAVSGSKSVSIVQYLLDKGANVNFISKDGKTPLDIAKSKEVAQLLKKVGGKTHSSLIAVPGTEDEAPLNTQERFNIIKLMSPMI